MPAKINLLIVDDEPATRKLLSQIFGQMGHSVRTASDGFTALQKIRESMPDVLLSDLHMPGMSGFELLSVVRRRLQGIYVIATSGAYAGDRVPFGVAADAFYEKATGFRSLLSLMETASTAEPLFRRETNGPIPVWVTATDNEDQCDEYVMITCPECMRAFSHAVDDSRFLVHEASCEDCATKVQYAVVQALDPQTSQPYHPQLAEALAPVISPELLRRSNSSNANDDLMVA